MLVSQDVCAKIDLHRHGGNGYDHVLVRIVPRLREAGVGDETLQRSSSTTRAARSPSDGRRPFAQLRCRLVICYHAR